MEVYFVRRTPRTCEIERNLHDTIRNLAQPYVCRAIAVRLCQHDLDVVRHTRQLELELCIEQEKRPFEIDVGLRCIDAKGAGDVACERAVANARRRLTGIAL